MRTAVGLGVAVVCCVGLSDLSAKEADDSDIPYTCLEENRSRRLFNMAYRSRYGQLDRFWGYNVDFYGDDACQGLEVFLQEHDASNRFPPRNILPRNICWIQGQRQAVQDFETDVRQECCSLESGQAGRQAAQAYCEQLLAGDATGRPPHVTRRHCDEMARQSCAFTFSRTVWFDEACRQRMADVDPEVDALYRLANEVCAPSS